ncbi:hypothetical protein D3C75_830700 [compost metagenome]
MPAGLDLAGFYDGVNIIGQRQGDHIRLQAVHHLAGLGAGAAMGLLHGDGLAGLLLPVICKGFIVGFIELPGRVIRNIGQLHSLGSRCGGRRSCRCRCCACRSGGLLLAAAAGQNTY